MQLACQLKVKELNGLSVWNKRFCVLCGSRMFIFATSRPKGKPTLVLDLTGGNITAHRIKKHFYCLKITASKKEILLSFESRLVQSKWLERAAKVFRMVSCSHIPQSLPKFLSHLQYVEKASNENWAGPRNKATRCCPGSKCVWFQS